LIRWNNLSFVVAHRLNQACSVFAILRLSIGPARQRFQVIDRKVRATPSTARRNASAQRAIFYKKNLNQGVIEDLASNIADRKGLPRAPEMYENAVLGSD
jgi:hypothetical protein